MTNFYPPKLTPAKTNTEIISFIKDTFANQHKIQAVVAVSGGIDSVTVLNLTTQALGPDHVHVLALPALESSQETTDSATSYAISLGIPDANIHELNLALVQQAIAKTLSLYQLDHTASNLQTRLGNISARIRMIFIFDLAKSIDALVVGTENLSEHHLGYFTRFGDSASDLEPILHLYKSQVYELAVHLGVPNEFITRPPSAGLWADQTDEAELGFSYAAADPIIYLATHDHLTKDQIVAKGFDAKLVTAVLDKIKANRYKHQVPYSLTHTSGK